MQGRVRSLIVTASPFVISRVEAVCFRVPGRRRARNITCIEMLAHAVESL